MFTNHFSLPQSLLPLEGLNLLIRRNVIPPLTIQFLSSSNGFLTTTVMTFAWNLLANIDYLLEQSGNSIHHEEIASKLLRSLKSKKDTVIESIEGYQMTDSQKYRMHLIRAHMDYITAEINDVDREIENLISSDPD